MRKARKTSTTWWIRRDGTRMLVALLGFVSILMVSAYMARWAMKAPRVQLADTAVAANKPSDDEIYTGSIVFVPQQGDVCWLRYLDNLTGRLWDKGKVSCDATLMQHTAQNARDQSARMAAIRNGFRGNGP